MQTQDILTEAAAVSRTRFNHEDFQRKHLCQVEQEELGFSHAQVWGNFYMAGGFQNLWWNE